MSLESKRLGPLGVEVVDLDLRLPISQSDWQALRELVMHEGLVVFRDQPMDAQKQLELGCRFGEIENTSTDLGPMDESKTLLSNVDAEGRLLDEDHVLMQLVAINEGWHTDSSFREIPASFSLFSGLTVPEQGGDTFFASLRLGWDALPIDEREALYGLSGFHDYNRAYEIREVDVTSVFGGAAPGGRHPILRRHPETGKTGLFVSEHMFGIEGLSDDEAKRLTRRLLDVCTDASRTYRHHWSVGDLLIWDNRSMLHRAQGFDSRHPRVMRHVRVAGTEAAIAATR